MSSSVVVDTKKKSKVTDKSKLQKNPGKFLFMFATVQNGGYVLYRLYISDLLHKRDEEVEFRNLLPWIKFKRGDLPNFCTMIPLKKYFYFIGEKATDVFRIKNLEFVERYAPHPIVSQLVTQVSPHMKSPKVAPLVFTANGNLYVISREYSYYKHCDFEMYSPNTNNWTTLKPKPHGVCGNVKSFLVRDEFVYFATTSVDYGGDGHSVLSYHFISDSWTLLTTSPVWDFVHNLRPAFDHPVVLVGEMVFGGFERNLTVGASPDSHLTPDTKEMFMRPSLAPDFHFWKAFSRRHDYVLSVAASHHMTALHTKDGQNVLCCVSYGTSFSYPEPVAFFTLLKIPGTVSRGPPKDEGMDDYAQWYYQLHPQKEFGTDSYFRSEFMHSILFRLPAKDYHGRLITCFTC